MLIQKGFAFNILPLPAVILFPLALASVTSAKQHFTNTPYTKAAGK